MLVETLPLLEERVHLTKVALTDSRTEVDKVRLGIFALYREREKIRAGRHETVFDPAPRLTRDASTGL
eukprot:12345736-Prorocentrum_lima.AAC.1